MAVWSEVRKSELSADLRLDAQYYCPDILALRQTLTRSPFPRCRLEDISRSIINFGAYSLCNDIKFLRSGVRFITAENIHDSYIDFSDCRFISEDQHHRLLWKSQVVAGQVLVSMAARLGYAAVYEFHEPLNSSQDIAKVTLTDPSATNPFYIAAFINSRLGREQLLAAQTGSVQQHTNLGKIKDLIVVLPPRDVQVRIANVFRSAISEREKSLAGLSKAESILNSALGLDKADLAPRLFYEDRFSRVAAAGRFDAEYFQPCYTTLLANLKKCPNVKLMTIKELCGRLKYGTSEKLPYIEEGAPFLRIADLQNKRFNLSSVLRIPAQLAQGISEKVHTGDILVSRSGTLGVAVPIKAELDGAVYGSYFIKTHPNPEEIDPEYLCLFINSKAGQMQVEMLSSGGIQTNLTIDAIESIMVPVGDKQWQMKFVELVNNSVDSRQESRRLLETAKRAVEIAIEDGEEAARQFLAHPGPE